MSIKKKLAMGAMAASMSVALIGGGTWAAFNDVERVNAGVAAGELNLDLKKLGGQPYNFDISNLKPGDFMTRSVKFDNIGTLAIKDIILSVDNVDFTDYIPAAGEPGYNDSDTHGTNTAVEYLSQFKITVATVGAEGGSGGFPKNIILSDITLADLYQASDLSPATAAERAAAQAKISASVDSAYYAGHGINVATINPDEWTGLPVVPHDDDNLEVTIEFDNDLTDSAGDGTYDQNIFQGDSADVTFTFEARQWDGQEVTASDLNASGEVVTNREANNGEPVTP